MIYQRIDIPEPFAGANDDMKPIPLAQLPAGQPAFYPRADSGHDPVEVLGGPDSGGLYALRVGRARIAARGDTIVCTEAP